MSDNLDAFHRAVAGIEESRAENKRVRSQLADAAQTFEREWMPAITAIINKANPIIAPLGVRLFPHECITQGTQITGLIVLHDTNLHGPEAKMAQRALSLKLVSATEISAEANEFGFRWSIQVANPAPRDKIARMLAAFVTAALTAKNKPALAS